MGGLVRPGDPNYAYFCRAIGPIQRLLDIVTTGRLPRRLTEQTAEPHRQLFNEDDNMDWDTWNGMGLWEFDTGFWDEF